MAASEIDEPLLGTLRHSIVGLVRRDGPDLSARQLAVFLACYLETEAQTVRGLAAKLNISKPAVSRALDRLEEFSLVRREDDRLDRRSVLIRRTRAGLSLSGAEQDHAGGVRGRLSAAQPPRTYPPSGTSGIEPGSATACWG